MRFLSKKVHNLTTEGVLYFESRYTNDMLLQKVVTPPSNTIYFPQKDLFERSYKTGASEGHSSQAPETLFNTQILAQFQTRPGEEDSFTAGLLKPRGCANRSAEITKQLVISQRFSQYIQSSPQQQQATPSKLQQGNPHQHQQQGNPHKQQQQATPSKQQAPAQRPPAKDSLSYSQKFQQRQVQ